MRCSSQDIWSSHAANYKLKHSTVATAATVHQKTKNVQTINLQKQIEINATYEAAMMQHTNNRTPLQMQLMLQTNSK